MTNKLEQALESGTIQFPKGLTGEERRAFIKEKLMNNVEKTRRKLFENLIDDSRQLLKYPNGTYVDPFVSGVWWGLNQTLDSLEVELPALKNSSSYYDGGDVHDSAINHCRYNIESLNLGIKIK